MSRTCPQYGVLSGRFMRKYLIKISSGQPISRILSGRRLWFTSPEGLHPIAPACTIISLSSLPGTDNEASSLSSLLGLAPGGGYLAARIAADAGGLLHHLFTIAALRQQSVSVARSGRFACEGFPVPGFPRRRALWSADFPRSHAEAWNRDRPASLRTISSYLFLECASTLHSPGWFPN